MAWGLMLGLLVLAMGAVVMLYGEEVLYVFVCAWGVFCVWGCVW